MAFPTIKIDGTGGGSNTAASGAGPATALFGTGGATALSASNRIAFFGSTPDLSGVDTTGLHAVWIDSGADEFHKITGKKDTVQSVAGDTTAASDQLTNTTTSGMTSGDIIKVTNAATGPADLITTISTVDGASTITMVNAADLTTVGETVTNPDQVIVSSVATGLSSKNWGIGGKRATLAGSSNLHASGGTLAPGWTVEFSSGFLETFASTLSIFSSGNDTDGPVTWRGESGGIRPIITFSNNGNGFLLSSSQGQTKIKFLELRNTNATKTSGIALHLQNGQVDVDDVKIDHATNYPNICIAYSVDQPITLRNCSLRAKNEGVLAGPAGQNRKLMILGCYIHDCGSHGINFQNQQYLAQQIVEDCVITNNGGNGILINQVQTIGWGGYTIKGNTIDGNTGDGIEVNSGGSKIGFNNDIIVNNSLSNNGGYGLNFNSFTAADITALMMMLYSNNTYNNTSGASNPSGILVNDPGLDPQYTNPAGEDWTIGINLKERGYPDNNIGEAAEGDGSGSNTRSYVDIGAAQRQEPAGGAGGLLVHPGTTGGFNA